MHAVLGALQSSSTSLSPCSKMQILTDLLCLMGLQYACTCVWICALLSWKISLDGLFCSVVLNAIWLQMMPTSTSVMAAGKAAKKTWKLKACTDRQASKSHHLCFVICANRVQDEAFKKLHNMTSAEIDR